MTKKLLTPQFPMVIALPTTTLSQHNCTHPSSPHSPPHPPRKRFRRLKKQELLRLQGGLQPLEEWCEDFNKHLPDVPTSDLVPIVDAILRECSEAYHSSTTPAGRTAPSKMQKEFAQLANALPQASHPRFGEKMRQLNDYLDEWQKAKQKSARTAVHRAIVQGRQLKSAIQKHLQPPDQAAISLRRSDGTLATDTKEVAKMFSDTLLHLGCSPDYTPPLRFH